MLRSRPLLRFAWLVPLALVAACGSKSSAPSQPEVDAGSPSDFMDNLKDDSTCILNCDPGCTEATTPWTCPALADWTTLPHDPTGCGAFDGTTYPAPQQGKCTATAPSGDAVRKTNASGTPVVLPDGRRIDPAGNEWLFTDFPGGFPDGALQVPGTKWLLVVDTGYTTHSVRALDTSLLRGTPVANPVVSSIRYDPPKALNWGMAYAAGSNVLYVASGYKSPDDTQSLIYAYDFDTTAGKLTADAAKNVPLPMGAFPQGVAVSADGKTLLVGQVTDSHVLVFSLDSASYGMAKGSIDVGANDVFELRFDPNDATGNTAYATLWISPAAGTDSSSMRVAQLDVAGLKSQTIGVGKEPEDMVFLDARYMVVANGLSDSLAVIDRPASKVAATVPLGTAGLEPTSLAYDAANKRLYATLSSVNAVGAFDVDDTQMPPSITPAGHIPTGWWPTAVVVDADGTLYVTTGRGHGTQGLNVDGDNGTYLQGSIQAIPFMSSALLAAATTVADGDSNVSSTAGYSTVQCGGAPYDFPVPATTSDGPQPAHPARLLHRAREQDLRRPLRRSPRRRRRAELHPLAAVPERHLGERAQVGGRVRAHGQLLLGRRAIDPGPLLGRLRAHVGRRRAALGRHLGSRRVRPDRLARGERLQRAARGEHLLEPEGPGRHHRERGRARGRPRLQELQVAERRQQHDGRRHARRLLPRRALARDVRHAAVRLRVARQRPHLRPLGRVPEPRADDGGERRGDGACCSTASATRPSGRRASSSSSRTIRRRARTTSTCTGPSPSSRRPG